MNRRSPWILRTLTLAVLGLSLTACVVHPGGRYYGGGHGYRSHGFAYAAPAYGGWHGGGRGGGWGQHGGYRGWR